MSGGSDWTGGLGLLDWLPHTPAPWSDTNATSPDSEGGGAACVEDPEMQDLRERLAQAEARAKAAEEAAKVAIQEARSETERLAKELANVERGTKDQMEAEAIRRAKWAKEQAARNQLDAYERSKLEADEMRRRRAIEEQRALECDRARRIREEQEWREEEAERIKQEYEIKIQILAEREAALKAEAEARERRERERRLQQQVKEDYRRCRLTELTEALRREIESDGEAPTRPMLAGWLNLQLDGEVHRKRRWYEVIGRELVLCRSATDRSLKTIIGLDSTRLLWVSDQHEDCTMDQSLVLEVQQGCASGYQSYIIHLESTMAKEDMELMIEAISRL